MNSNRTDAGEYDVTFLWPFPTGARGIARVRALFAACNAFEWLTLGYLTLLNLLLVLFHHNLSRPFLFITVHSALAIAIVALAWLASRTSNRLFLFMRHWYPLALFLFFFEELHYLVRLIFPGWFDHWLIQFDYALLGAHPTVWMQQFGTPALTDFLQFAYMTYYLYTVVLGGLLYRRGELRAFWVLMTSTAAAYYAGYLISILFPIEGPYHTLAALHRVELTGGVFTSAINWIESWGRVHGGAFPSAHVSGSFVVILAAWRYRRRLFWVFLPFFAAMLVATVYGRYHYVADVLAGILVAAVAFVIVGRRPTLECGSLLPPYST
jgi:membrane-associated phospholipid phosphatase